MRGLVSGKVSALGEPRSYTRRDGGDAHVVDVFLAPDDPRYAPDRLTMPCDIAPAVGEDVTYKVAIDAKLSQRGSAYLSVWGLERVESPLRAVS
jgi:hypothetical protein